MSSPNHVTTNMDVEEIKFRSFWKAGEIKYSHTEKPPRQGQMEHVRVHPKFLHSNATSHKWAFGAIAELLDNAVDEIPNGATFVNVEKFYDSRNKSEALLFQDNGGGMDPSDIRQCMSLGYSSKKTKATIGQYGNGFKTSTMRLGADVIVFSRKCCGGKTTESIGFLSYTYLRRTGQDDIIVPVVDFEILEGCAKPLIHTSTGDWQKNVNVILEWSPFTSEEMLRKQFEDIGLHGTKVIIFNLWLDDNGVPELDFESDREDIRLRDHSLSDNPRNSHTEVVMNHISMRIRHSLRAYASILYLHKYKNFQIVLCGKPVEQISITDQLQFPQIIKYKPQMANSTAASVDVTVGFVQEGSVMVIHGFNVYHRNRLILPFWKVCNQSDSRGRGVVGFLEANFLEPAHDKQDFERSSLCIRLETKLRQIAVQYWLQHHLLIGCNEGAVNATIRNFSNNTTVNAPMIGLAASSRVKSSGLFPAEREVGIHHIPAGQATTSQPDMQQPNVILIDEGYCKDPHVDQFDPVSLDKICEENIQLFMRCEQHKGNVASLRQKKEKLTEELIKMKEKYLLLLSEKATD